MQIFFGYLLLNFSANRFVAGYEHLQQDYLGARMMVKGGFVGNTAEIDQVADALVIGCKRVDPRHFHQLGSANTNAGTSLNRCEVYACSN